MKTERRVGTFDVSFRYINAMIEGRMSNILSEIIIVRAESLFVEDCIRYVGYSDHFRYVKEGEIIPGYRVIISDDSVYFEEVKL